MNPAKIIETISMEGHKGNVHLVTELSRSSEAEFFINFKRYLGTAFSYLNEDSLITAVQQIFNSSFIERSLLVYILSLWGYRNLLEKIDLRRVDNETIEASICAASRPCNIETVNLLLHYYK